MRFIHYTDIPIESLELRDYAQDLLWMAKPNGLWFSVETKEKIPKNYNWKEWCESQEIFLENLSMSYEIILNKDAKIIHLKTSQEIIEFGKSYPYLREQWKDPIGRELCKSYELDWNKVKSKYQGIIISPYQWDCRISHETLWYYGWDCSSGCIWDLSCIKEFIPRKFMPKRHIDEKEHPFPNEELLLMQKLHKEEKISKEDIEKLSNLLHKYLNLRADVFHEI